MSIPLEIERKFLPTSWEDMREALQMQFAYNIQQCYVVNTPEVAIRYRIEDVGGPDGLRAIICIKRAISALVREEEQYDVDLNVARMTMTGVPVSHVISKTRYEAEGFDIDVFHHALTGLVLVEREFPTVEEAEAFVVPSWIDMEVTEDPDYINSNLIGKRYDSGRLV